MNNHSYIERSDDMEKCYEIKNLECAHCGAKIEALISDMTGIESAVLNFPLKKLTVKGEFDEDTLPLMNELAKAIEPDTEIIPFVDRRVLHSSKADTSEQVAEEDENEFKKEIIPLAVGVLLFIIALVTEKLVGIKYLPLIFYVPAYLILGRNVLVSTFKNIRIKNFFDENTLMTVATLGAFALGEYSEAVGVVLFFMIGEMFEDYAVSKSRKAITDVADLRVDEADIFINGEFVRTSSEDIQKGDLIRVKTGERIAVDGVIESGESRIDTSAVNGEPVPLTVRKGDSVMSGCINLADTFTMRAEEVASESMISRIAKAVENASAEKPEIDRFITRFSKVYTPFVISVSFLTAVIGTLLTKDTKWIYSALTFLVISCPCALVLSVPLAYFSGIGAASKLGILFKGGNSLEALAKVKAVAFDKTGTLTNGSFTVTEIKSFGKLDENSLMKICGSCEQVSTHPVAESITASCKQKGISLEEPQKSCELAGRGIQAVFKDRNVLCGNQRLMNENNIQVPEENSVSGSVVYVAVDGKIEGRITVSDTIKKSSEKAVSMLKSMNIKTAMLTGDKKQNAEVTGKKLGIDIVESELMPEDKLKAIEKIRSQNGAVMFVGDGINDAPVLAGADVGGAMQTGSDIALEAADAVFMNSEPESIVTAKKIADKAYRISYENIIFALGVKAIVLVLGIAGIPNMWFAVFADSGTAVISILNSIRILRTKQYK